MGWRIRRIGIGDEYVLSDLASHDAEFDVAGRTGERAAIGRSDAAAYLADPNVLHWVAEEASSVIGHVLCYLERRRIGESRQLLLYEIGVRSGWRRRGIGRALMSTVDGWMTAEGVRDIWVLADNADAVAFYNACGFRRDAAQPVLMGRSSAGSN